MKKLITLMLAVVLCLSGIVGCCAAGEQVTTGEIGVILNEEFGHIYIELTIDEFNALGFAFGDSVDVVFSNGKEIQDLPYFSGYFVPVGELVACGYPGYPHVVIARNFSGPTWDEFGMTDDTTVTITLNEKGKYLAVQELYSLEYSNIRESYPSDVAFANYREVKGGSLKPRTFYRSASPCNNQNLRASSTDRLTELCGIRFVLNLSDTETKYQAHTEAEDFDSPYYASLYQEGNVLLLGMNANYRSDDFAKILSEAFLAMSEHEGPCLIHCVEGKDRTGFACTLLLALAGASPQEIIDDYMITFTNYYGVTKEEMPDRYNAILGNMLDFFYCLCDVEKGTDPDTLDLRAGAENYLRRGGLSDEQVAQIEAYIMEPDAQ